MKDLFGLLKRFVPPYKGKVILNMVFNFLGALFGAFSFAMLIPALGILFNTQELVTQKPEISSLNLDHILELFNYYISQVVINSGNERALIYIGGFIIIMVMLKVGFTYFASFVMVYLRNGVVRDIRSQMYQKILQLPLGFFSDERKGDIIARMTGDVQEVENSVMNSLEMLFKNPVIIIISLAAMLYMSWSLTLFVFVLLPVAGFVIGRIGKSLKKTSMRGQNKMGDILSITEEDISGLRVIKAFNAEEKAYQRFDRENESYLHIMNKLMWRRFLAHPMSELLGTTVIIIVLWYGGALVLKNESSLSAQAFIGYLVFFYNIINPAKAFSTALYSVEKGLASMNRIDRILSQENTIKDGANARSVEGFEESVTYENVSFRYVNENVLDQVNLDIKKGQTIAFVGKSGSGKTTLVDLLPRFWDVSEGRILIDGTDIRDIRLHDLRNLMGNVNQEPILFNDTFYNNIAFGVEDATEEDVIHAAKIANAHEFIMNTEQGYQTNIGDRGDKLSGGQKQRISIARAILKNPPILILDEATSALDTESEKLVQEALENLMKNRTSLVIAHRLSTIKNADVICVLHKGKIVEHGTHQELIDKKGRYYKLHQMQVF
ncbi:ABC transporter ATP-binding protein [Sunxiuqinia elliptica]|uniref:Subfamily B ATP-binding cassette protein MsbA n=1 Tax=Sunxiuqinia elliptica TaxID=655355 RepID=A0A4R6GLX4_9BACT|nr:ABC transporter ATP-binding protein [Sunxiuqinia elliptica]TDN96182.1 subfamily B ATP-binding cassette protein MsbA [Sunxiuqinia elliptica]TDO67893.1 subfamily B ATP-binding cassette protein MsbA [Sunxiuqinia elliptica]